MLDKTIYCKAISISDLLVVRDLLSESPSILYRIPYERPIHKKEERDPYDWLKGRRLDFRLYYESKYYYT